MKVDPNYGSLKISIDPMDDNWSGKNLAILARAIKAWEWQDPIRKKKLPPVLELEPNYTEADVLVKWKDDLGWFEGPGPEHGDTVRQRLLGFVMTDPDGEATCTLWLSRKMFSEAPGAAVTIVSHEVGHALGLIHGDGGVMAPWDFLSPRIVTMMNRERAAELRLEGVIGVVEPDHPRLVGHL